MLLLGPMPAAVRATVQRLVAASWEPVGSSQPIVGYLLWGGPAGADYLDADGEVWSWNWMDDSVTRVPDGPHKVGSIAIAAEREPEMAPWLPRRPEGAHDCDACQQTGWLQPPWPRIQCPDCFGMGWR